MRDTTANYDLRYSQAANSLSSNKNTRASTEISLDKAVSDAKLSLERAEMDLKTVESQTTLSLEKALRDAQKSDTASATSDATVTLAQLQASLDKSKLDYQNLISSNTQTLKNFTYSFNTSVSDLSRLYTKLLFEGDRLYGITPAFQSENTNIRRFMGTTSLK